MSVLLSLEDVTVAYGKVRAVERASLVVPDGAVVALLGPNGAGKSSLLRAIAGLVPCRGRIVFDGHPIHGMSAHAIARRGVCSIPEGRGIFGALTVAENLRLAAGTGDSQAFAERVYEAFPALRARGRQAAGTLSGGEQQMLALARAVAAPSRLLTIDEPSLGLAPTLVAGVYDLIRRLRDDGRSILLVEQFAAHAVPAADLVAVMAQGRVVFWGEPGELAYAPPLVERYLGQVTAS